MADARRLAGADLVLEAPRSLAERWDAAITHARTGCEHRAHALALGLCWRRFRTRHPYRGDPLAYSATVIDTLLADGATLDDILSTGREAYNLIALSLVRVEPDATPFSGTPADPDGAAPAH